MNIKASPQRSPAKEYMKRLTIGILAHVDAGKTTLSERLLYITGKIKAPGRVDHGDTYLDTHEYERERGITIFSSSAELNYGELAVTLLDTPGHVDFSSEAERTLAVLDYAVLVISGSDGVQNHTKTLWQLLARYHIPTFIFVNKMDLPDCDKAYIMSGLCRSLDSACVDFSQDTAERDEKIALCGEEIFEKYLRDGSLSDADITGLTTRRGLFPVCFGSALRGYGITELLDIIEKYSAERKYPENEFAATVYKISRDEKNNRLTHMKITGGTLCVRDKITYTPHNSTQNATQGAVQGSVQNDTQISEKITQIRIYSGEKYTSAESVEAGRICVVTGLSATYPGQGLGSGRVALPLITEPVLEYRIILPPDCDIREYYPRLRTLEEEDPALHIDYSERLGELHIRLLGDVQTEIIKRLVYDRFGIEIAIDSGKILYRETIAESVSGVGHFEPLQHYAEVHLLLQPLEAGSGLVFSTVCSENTLARGWQRSVLHYLRCRSYPGVLTGAPITDMKITLVAGRSHPKHTEGGDFRQAAVRALRQGLMSAKSVLLEPYYSFKLTLPSTSAGRAINDINMMSGTFSAPEDAGDGFCVISGRAPVSAMRNYTKELISYTHGTGRFSFELAGYYPCHNADEVIAASAYNPEADLQNPPDSVFCAHGAGFTVKWNRVREYMHVDPGKLTGGEHITALPQPRVLMRNLKIDERELEAIMEREFGPIKRRSYSEPNRIEFGKDKAAETAKRDFYIIDGYNIIFAWDELRENAMFELDLARRQLLSLLASFRAYTLCDVVVVFDAYNVSDGAGERSDYNGVRVVYTRADETGDAYIERLVTEIGRNYRVRVVTSDAMIQMSALRGGVLRMTASEFKAELDFVNEQISHIIEGLSRPNPRDTVYRQIIPPNTGSEENTGNVDTDNS